MPLAPALVAVLLATLAPQAFFSPAAWWIWSVVTLFFSMFCAAGRIKPTSSPGMRATKTILLGFALFVANAFIGFFGGCVCALSGLNR